MHHIITWAYTYCDKGAASKSILQAPWRWVPPIPPYACPLPEGQPFGPWWVEILEATCVHLVQDQEQ